MCDSSAVILNSVLYNIGGEIDSDPVSRCSLGSNAPVKWEPMNLLNYSFNEYSAWEALVLENKILYFGSAEANQTYVLECDSEQLKVARED